MHCIPKLETVDGWRTVGGRPILDGLVVGDGDHVPWARYVEG